MIIKLVLTFIIAFLSGCHGTGYISGPKGVSCKSSCITFADDGETCVEYSDVMSKACAGEYTEVYQCCTQVGSCPVTYGKVYQGFQCTCHFQTAYGMQSVNGRGCD